MKTPYGDTLRELTNVKEKPNSTSFITRESFQNSAIQLVCMHEKEYFLTIGQHRITPTYASRTELEEYIKTSWTQIQICLMCVIAEETINTYVSNSQQ